MNKKTFYMLNFLLAILVFVSPSSILAQPLQHGEKLYQEALTADKNGQLIEAMQLSKEASEKGHPGAQSFYGFLLDKAEFDEEAEAWYRKAIAQDNIAGMLHLARLQTTKANEKNIAEALSLYQKAANLGSTQAIKIIARAYKKGDLGLQQNQQTAVSWFLKAADKKDADSILTLARAYEKGQLGLPVDYKKALQLYQQASTLNSREAAFRLQRAYQNGELGENKDPVQAKLWQTRLNELKAK